MLFVSRTAESMESCVSSRSTGPVPRAVAAEDACPDDLNELFRYRSDGFIAEALAAVVVIVPFSWFRYLFLRKQRNEAPCHTTDRPILMGHNIINRPPGSSLISLHPHSIQATAK